MIDHNNQDENKADYQGGPTWVDKEYDPRFMEKNRFAFLKKVGTWLLNNVLAKVIIGIILVVATIYITQFMQPSQEKNNQTQKETSVNK